VVPKLCAFIVMIATTLVMSGCGGDSKDYDIGPIFPLSDPAQKCAKYHGDAKGEGLTASCMVTKDECEKAAKEWESEMQNVPDAILFTCN